MAPGRGKPTQAASVLHTDEVTRVSDTAGMKLRNDSTVAIDATPAFVTLAWFVASEGPVITVRERVTFYEVQD